MANVIFTEQENVRLHPPSLKMRQRLLSAPEKQLKSPMLVKNTPVPSARKAFGVVNKKILTPSLSTQEKKVLKPQEVKVEHPSEAKGEEYPEIEKFIPYNPLEFEKYSVPEDFIPFSGLALPGLACFTLPPLEEDLEKILPLPDPSPAKGGRFPDHSLELDAFLQTLEELTVEFPPEPLTDC
uniref:Securin n=1 Tax=Oryzias sinensis TaxID=183150 RepID=A0A8C8DHR7_9TELE